MDFFICFIEGAPVAQGRPRFTTRGGYARAYDPPKSKEWKEEVARQIKLSLPSPYPLFKEGPLVVNLDFYMPKPKSLPKKVIDHVKKPDLDNLGKAIKDAMNGLVYKDDSQVVHLIIRKMYAITKPGVNIEVFTKEFIGRADRACK